MFKPNSKAILFLELTLPKSNKFVLKGYVNECIGPYDRLSSWAMATIGAEVTTHSPRTDLEHRAR